MSLFQPVTDKLGESVPEGLYLVRVVGVGLYEPPPDAPPSQYGDNPRAQWKFLIEQVISADTPRPTKENPDPKSPEEFINYELRDYSSLTMGPKSKARDWSVALFDRELEEGETIDPDKLIGCRARATIGRSETGRHKIVKLMPYRQTNGKRRHDDGDDEPF